MTSLVDTLVDGLSLVCRWWNTMFSVLLPFMLQKQQEFQPSMYFYFQSKQETTKTGNLVWTEKHWKNIYFFLEIPGNSEFSSVFRQVNGAVSAFFSGS